jgi:hypothetical protein
VGGAATVTTHWITQKAVNKRELKACFSARL